MTMFGRDSIFTSLQALPFAPELAAHDACGCSATGRAAATTTSGTRTLVRILHEMRYGEMAAFEERPHSPYYGAADSTPLFVVLLDEYERWTGDRKLVRDLEFEARLALAWIDEYADLMGNGYISYKRRNEQTGLENQCLEGLVELDPRTAMADCRTSRGRRVSSRATRTTPRSEVPGSRGSSGRTRRSRSAWSNRQPSLKHRFDRDYWLPDRGYYALALDADGSQSMRSRRISVTSCGVASSTHPKCR